MFRHKMLCAGCNRTVHNEQVHTRCPRCIDDSEALRKVVARVKHARPDLFKGMLDEDAVKKLYLLFIIANKKVEKAEKAGKKAPR